MKTIIEFITSPLINTFFLGLAAGGTLLFFLQKLSKYIGIIRLKRYLKKDVS